MYRSTDRLIKICNLWNRRWRKDTKWTFVSRTPAGSLILMSSRSKISNFFFNFYLCLQARADLEKHIENCVVTTSFPPQGGTSMACRWRRSHIWWIIFRFPYPSTSSWLHRSHITWTRDVDRSSRRWGGITKTFIRFLQSQPSDLPRRTFL